jgi:hypothetical protein
MLTIERNSIHPVGTRKGPIFAQDFGVRSLHAAILVTR